jgi:hypothetical protein
MSKISTYPSADVPLQLSDRLIGTEAPRPTPSSTPLATKNFSLGELLQLFSSNFPAATLQAVLNAGNIATNDINLTGTIYVDLIKPTNIEDMLGSQGTPFQVLSKAIGGFNWIDLPDPITLTTNGSSGASTLIGSVLNIPIYSGGSGTTPTLQQVTTAGAITTDAIQVGGITAGNFVADGFSVGISDSYDSNYNFLYMPFGSGLYIGDGLGNGTTIYPDSSIGFTTAVGFSNLRVDLLTSGKTWQLPDANGTLALTTDITTPTLQEVLIAGNTTTETAIFGDITADYLSIENNSIGIANSETGESSNFTIGGLQIFDNDNNYAEINFNFGFSTGNLLTGGSYLKNDQLVIQNAEKTATLSTDYLVLQSEIDSVSNITVFNIDKLTVDGNEYLYPTGASSPLATLADITGATPTLQQILDNNRNLVNGNFFAGTDSGAPNTGTNVIAIGNKAGSDNIFKHVYLFGDGAIAKDNNEAVFSKYSLDASPEKSLARFSFSNISADRKYTLPDATGTIALTSDIPSGGGTVTSVDLSMPSAFTVTNNPVTTSGTLTVTGAGLVSQYIRGDGTLANFPNSTGGGSSVNYYLNGSISQGTFGGDTYYQMSKTPVLGAGTNFTRTNGAGNGYIASFITDAGDPSQLNIPGGNWNVEFYFNASSGGGTPSFYAELYTVSATNVFTLIASDSLNPEGITNGTTVDQYFTSIPVPQTTLLATDRLAIRIFVNTGGRTITLHTENGNLSEVLTTFTTGLTALNGLTAQVQNFAVGTTGTDFGISSATETHTFNLPTASATNRGALSSADWSRFNDIDFTRKLITNGTGSVTGTTAETILTSLTIPANTLDSKCFIWTTMDYFKTSGNACTLRLYINTTNSTSGATLIGFASVGSNRNVSFNRKLYLNGTTLDFLSSNTGVTQVSSEFVESIFGASTTLTVNPAANIFLIYTTQNDAVGTTATNKQATVQKLKLN